jgi:hypothetical protein
MLNHVGIEIVDDSMIELWEKATTLLIEDSMVQRIWFRNDQLGNPLLERFMEAIHL